MSSPHSSWDSPGNWSPQSPVRRSPLLATPPENGYIVNEMDAYMIYLFIYLSVYEREG